MSRNGVMVTSTILRAHRGQRAQTCKGQCDSLEHRSSHRESETEGPKTDCEPQQKARSRLPAPAAVAQGQGKK